VRAALAIVLAFTAAQSPFYDAARKLEADRREAARRDQALIEEEQSAGRPVAIAFRQGKPLAWVSVVRTASMSPHCGIPSEWVVFAMDDQQLYECRAGVRAPMRKDYAVVLSWGKTTVLDWASGSVEEHRLR
jgi:hypothetical protein